MAIDTNKPFGSLVTNVKPIDPLVTNNTASGSFIKSSFDVKYVTTDQAMQTEHPIMQLLHRCDATLRNWLANIGNSPVVEEPQASNQSSPSLQGFIELAGITYKQLDTESKQTIRDRTTGRSGEDRPELKQLCDTAARLAYLSFGAKSPIGDQALSPDQQNEFVRTMIGLAKDNKVGVDIDAQAVRKSYQQVPGSKEPLVEIIDPDGSTDEPQLGRLQDLEEVWEIDHAKLRETEIRFWPPTPENEQEASTSQELVAAQIFVSAKPGEMTAVSKQLISLCAKYPQDIKSVTLMPPASFGAMTYSAVIDLPKADRETAYRLSNALRDGLHFPLIERPPLGTMPLGLGHGLGTGYGEYVPGKSGGFREELARMVGDAVVNYAKGFASDKSLDNAAKANHHYLNMPARVLAKSVEREVEAQEARDRKGKFVVRDEPSNGATSTSQNRSGMSDESSPDKQENDNETRIKLRI